MPDLSDVLVPARFCGPPSSGNGGWSAGAIALRAAEACPTDHSLSAPSVTVSLQAPPPLDDLGGLVRALEAVGDLAHELTLRSYTMRRPCRVSQGSTCSIVSEYGAMSELNPPVATTVEGPSSSMKRRASASTKPAKP